MKYIKSYNESIKDFLKPKSKEDIMKLVLEQPKSVRYEYIDMHDLSDIFDENELKKFKDDALYVDYSDDSILYIDSNKNRYYYINEKYYKEGNDPMYIFDQNWDKISGEEYNNVKDAIEFFKLRME